MKSKYIILAFSFALISCGKEIFPIEDVNSAYPAVENITPVIFNVNIDELTKAESKKTWVNGDVVYVVFKGITTKYLKLIRNDVAPDGWDKIGMYSSFIATDFSGIADADKKLSAVFLPIQSNATLKDGSLFFTTASGGSYPYGGHIYSYYLKATDVSYSVIEDGINVEIDLNISLSIPDGFVQFHIPGIASADVDNYRFSSTLIQPTACSSISAIDGSITEDTRTPSSTIPMCFADSEGVIFSGKVYNESNRMRSFIIRSGGEKYSFSKERAIESGHFYKFRALDDAMWTHTSGNYDYVDLGLSVKWATWNLGSSAPEENGWLISWGVTSTQGEYDLASYRWYAGGEMSKYNATDGKEKLDPEDDAAYVVLGGKWRMPTPEEFNELRLNCSSVSTTINGVAGVLFTSKIDGYKDKSIFFPYAGSNDYNTRDYVGSRGYYWSSSRSSSVSSYAKAFNLNSLYVYDDYVRNAGFSIRPIIDF